MEEWDEVDDTVEKFFFGDKVITPNGDEGTVTEIDGDSEVKYRVDSSIPLGWFRPEELTKTV